MTAYFIVVGASFLLTRIIFAGYVESIGLEYNPNKSIKILGQEVKPFYSMLRVIDDYVKTKHLNQTQLKRLKAIRKWEYLNWIAFALFPIVIVLTLFSEGNR